MPDIIKEYLVRLGFGTDLVQYGRFQSTVRDATNLVEASTSQIAKKFLSFQLGVTGAFAGIATGLFGLAENAAMADQEYRLLALRMYTSLPVARELKIAMDALGQPLENIAWDPELARRFSQLVKDQETLGNELGPSFEDQMLKIRDIRFEFNRFGVELKYLTFMVVKDLARAFGTDADGLLGRLTSFNAWFIQNMPMVSEWITTRLKPILVDVKDILGETWHVVELTATAFTNLVGILSGDKSLEGTAANFDKMATAIQTSLGWVASFVKGIIAAEEAALHTINAAAALKDRRWGDARSEMGKAADVLTPKSWSVPGTQELTNQMVGDAAQQQKANRDLIIATAKQLEISPSLALAVAMHESGLMQWDKAGKLLTNLGTKEHPSHAMGLFQLEPGTAKQMGVDPTTVLGNVMGGIKLLKYWMNRPGGTEESALEHYYGNNFTPGANQAFAKTIMGMEAGLGGGPVPSHGRGESVTYSIVIQAPSGDAKAIAMEAERTIQTLERDRAVRVQRNIMEFQGWAYGNG